MNANYGLFPPLGGRWRGREKKLKLAERALADFDRWAVAQGLSVAPAAAAP
jgi:folate-dependent tRNA-U54 methylase TrmFO/GidA